MIRAETENSTDRRQGGIWDYVSPSRLALWAKCPLAFALKYVHGIKTPTKPSLFLGQRVHRSLEYFYRYRQLHVTRSTEQVLEHLQCTWDEAVRDEKMRWGSPAEAAQLRQKAAALVTAYLEQLPGDEPRPLAVETTMRVDLVDPLTGEDLGIPLVGIVDLVLDGEAGPVVIDFKSAAQGGDLPEINHELQLTCYAYCYRALTGRQESELQIRRLVKTKVPKIETHRYAPRSAAHFGRLFALLRAYLDDLRARRFTFRPGWTCGMCDFRETHCRSWEG